jgi:hypothetical protein
MVIDHHTWLPLTFEFTESKRYKVQQEISSWNLQNDMLSTNNFVDWYLDLVRKAIARKEWGDSKSIMLSLNLLH